MLKDKIEQDLLTFFDSVEGLSMNDKKEMLRLLLSKYSLLSTSKCLLDKHDLFMMSGKAKKNAVECKSKIYLGEVAQRLQHEEIRLMNIANAVISVLNTKDCFKRLPVFNEQPDEYKED